MGENADAVARAVIKHRQVTGLTQRKLAAVMGVHPNTISNWERGVTQPSPGQAKVLTLLPPAFLMPSSGPGEIAQARAALGSLFEIQASLVAANEDPAGARLRRTLDRLSDSARSAQFIGTIAKGVGPSVANGAARRLEEIATLADAAVADTQARLGAAEGLRSVRAAAGYTLTELAKLLNVTVQTVQRWEKEEVTPQVVTVRKAELVAARLAAAADAADPGIIGARTRLDAAVAAKAVAAVASLRERRRSSPKWKGKTRRLWSRWWPGV